MRFDEMELETVALDPAAPATEVQPDAAPAPRLRRLFALLTDLSLFGALVVGLSPLLPQTRDWHSVVALGGFLFVLSFYYFVFMWTLGGKTVGGAIFDVKIVSSATTAGARMPLKSAVIRWAALYLSFATAGTGFLLALLPSRRSLADRMSATRCMTES